VLDHLPAHLSHVFIFLTNRLPPRSPLFPYTTLFRSQSEIAKAIADQLQAKLSPSEKNAIEQKPTSDVTAFDLYNRAKNILGAIRSEEHTSELQSQSNLVCRLLLEKKKRKSRVRASAP